MISIPTTANSFYVSDSATVNLTGSGPQMLYPGAANQSSTIPSGSQVTIYIKSCGFVAVPNATVSSNLEINTDMFIGLYNTSTGVFQGTTPFISPYGTAANGIILNQCTSLNPGLQTLTPRVWRDFGVTMPLIVGQIAPSSGLFQVGVGFQFNFSAPILINYEYFIHGAWTAV